MTVNYVMVQRRSITRLFLKVENMN